MGGGGIRGNGGSEIGGVDRFVVRLGVLRVSFESLIKITPGGYVFTDRVVVVGSERWDAELECDDFAAITRIWCKVSTAM